MSGASIGYAYLRDHFDLRLPPPRRVASVSGSTTRVSNLGDTVAVPRHVAPASAAPLDHLQFALKHEGVDLAVISEVLPKIGGNEVTALIRNAPSGRYSRLIGYLWEHFGGRLLDDLPEIQGPTEVLFPEDRYFTGLALRNPRWRVAFNGIGSLGYCATIERTQALQAAVDGRLMDRAEAFLSSLDSAMQERAVNWAYLHETESSFAIERESPNEDKARKFVRVLHRAHQPEPIDEQYLVDLQNLVVTNVYDHAVQFRADQNYLTNEAKGPAGVTYVPPPPVVARQMMDTVMQLGNQRSGGLDPVLQAAVASFGLAFVHPFSDGNGRLSRFLFHKTLCMAGALREGRLLPVSVAMKRNEMAYLSALQSFSLPTRRFWTVSYASNDRFDCAFTGSVAMYRYWDATACAEFAYRMGEEALRRDLRAETDYLRMHDQVSRAMNERFDVANATLNVLIRSAIEQGGRVSGRRRDQFQHRVPPGFFEALETSVKGQLAEVVTTDHPAADVATED